MSEGIYGEDSFSGSPRSTSCVEGTEAAPAQLDSPQNQDGVQHQGEMVDWTVSALDASIMVWNSRPRRFSEIWRLDRSTKTVVALGIEGVVQLNPMASAIWLRLDGNHTIGSIANDLTGAYPDRNPNEIVIDIVSFISEMVAKRFLILNWTPL